MIGLSNFLYTDYECVKAIAEGLKRNLFLEEVDLSGMGIGPDGGIAIAEALKENSTLKNLDLSDNAIGKRGGEAIVKVLQINSTLCKSITNQFNTPGT